MTLFLLCLKVFFARILDVSLGTLRTIVVIKGKSLTASLIAFVEVLIWFLIAREALNSGQSSIWIAISYASGFATGTFIGSNLSRILIKGVVGIQVISDKISEEMIKTIKDHGFAVSIINLESYSKEEQNRKMLFIQLNNQKQKNLINLIKSLDSHAFIVVNDTKYVQNGFIK